MLPVFASVVLLFVCQDGAVADEQPIVNMMREVIYEADLYLAQNHMDHHKLPNIGLLPWDPLKFRNGLIGNFSTLELLGEPTVVQYDAPDGASSLNFDLVLGLEKIEVLYDFEVDVFGLYKKKGTATIKTKTDALHANVTITITSKKKCEAMLNTADVVTFSNFAIEIKPDSLHKLTQLNEAILNIVTPALLPFTNSIIKGVVSTGLFQDKFSEMVCKNFPI